MIAEDLPLHIDVPSLSDTGTRREFCIASSWRMEGQLRFAMAA